MKNKNKIPTVGIVPKSTSKHVERVKIDTLSTFLSCHRHFNKMWQGKIMKTVLPYAGETL
jgi:hypothetical protein